MLFRSERGLPAIEAMDEIVRDLWRLPQREFQYVAVNLLERLENKLPTSSIKTLEYMITHKSWWDTVDALAGHSVGTHFRRYPKIKEQYLKTWRKSENIWLRRTTILFQLGYKQETDFDLLGEIIYENLGSKEFFINKAIGWALRDRKSTRLNSSHIQKSRMPSSA